MVTDNVKIRDWRTSSLVYYVHLLLLYVNLTLLRFWCSDLVEHFNSYVAPASDSTPCATVLSSLLQSLQKIPHLAESRSRQIMPLFFKFLGYNNNDLTRYVFCRLYCVDGMVFGLDDILFSFTTASSCCFVFLICKCSVGSFNSDTCKGKEWKGILKEWLNLLKLMRNPKAFYQSQFLKDVLQIRLVPCWEMLVIVH